MNELYDDMLRKGLVSPGTHWLEQAVDQHNPRVTVKLANTIPVYPLDQWDIYLVNKISWN